MHWNFATFDLTKTLGLSGEYRTKSAFLLRFKLLLGFSLLPLLIDFCELLVKHVTTIISRMSHCGNLIDTWLKCQILITLQHILLYVSTFSILRLLHQSTSSIKPLSIVIVAYAFAMIRLNGGMFLLFLLSKLKKAIMHRSFSIQPIRNGSWFSINCWMMLRTILYI